MAEPATSHASSTTSASHVVAGGARVPDRIVNPNNLNVLRIAARMNSGDVARCASMNLFRYREVQKGYQPFKGKELAKLARVFGITAVAITDTSLAQSAVASVTASPPKAARKDTLLRADRAAGVKARHAVQNKYSMAARAGWAKRRKAARAKARIALNGHDPLPHVLNPDTPPLVLLFAAAAAVPPQRWPLAIDLLGVLARATED